MRTIFAKTVKYGYGDNLAHVTADTDPEAPIEVDFPQFERTLVLTLKESKRIRKAMKRAERERKALDQ